MYTDPGVISLLIASVAGFFFAIPLFFSQYRKKLKGWIDARFKKRNDYAPISFPMPLNNDGTSKRLDDIELKIQELDKNYQESCLYRKTTNKLLKDILEELEWQGINSKKFKSTQINTESN